MAKLNYEGLNHMEPYSIAHMTFASKSTFCFIEINIKLRLKLNQEIGKIIIKKNQCQRDKSMKDLL